jgi:glucose/arabinose dehydrogenase
LLGVSLAPNHIEDTNTENMEKTMHKLLERHPGSPLKASPTPKRPSLANTLFPTILTLASLALPAATQAATVWTGPVTTFTKAAGADPTQAANQDRLTPNVWITRGSVQGIFNAKSETLYTHNLSPAGTEWAYGTTASYASLTYLPWETWYGGRGTLPGAILGQDAVLHLITEDIYLDVKFTSWGSGSLSGGPFSYQRSTPPVANTPPTVAITSPTNGTALSTPASVTISADANDPGGSVASVQFLDGATVLGTDTAAPFSLTTDFYPGAHSLTAIATDNLGLMATSTVVSLTVTSTPIANPIAARIPKGDITVELKTIAGGMVSPLGMAVPDDGSGRIFVYDQAGFVWLVTAAGRSPTPVLDLRSRLVNIAGSYDERGLLGLALHTNFAQFPYLYTYTSEFSSGPADFPSVLQLGGTNNHQSVVAEWALNPSTTNVVNPSTRREVLRIDEPQSNHNSGAMHFGPDGLLYLTIGDGGQSNDVGNGHAVGGNAQDLSRILGKMIRIDVDGRNSANGKYGIPASNPFVGGGGLPEIYAYGLRNPFSHSFDRVTGQLYLTDVGQNKVEEVDIITAGGNYGWNLREGAFWFDSATGSEVTAPVRPPPAGLIDPIAQYDHDDGSAIIGGYVYHGTALPALANRYVFGDWGVFGSPSGRLYYLDANSNVNELRLGLADRALGLFLKGYGEDAAGELYIFTSKPQGPTGNGGSMFKLVPPPAAPLAVTSGNVVNGTNFQTAWAGGVGPFALQRKLALNEPVWMNETFTSGNSAISRVRGTSGFFRTVDTAGQTALPLTVTLNGAMERPANASAGTGTGILSLEGNTLKFSISYKGLSGVATAAHIHGATNTIGSAGVLIDLKPYNGGAYGSNGTLAGTLVLTDTQKAYLLAGQTYVNFHTAANPGGEIRGQIAPVLMQASLLGAYQTTPANTTASGFGTFMLVGTQLTYTVSFSGLSGPASAGHIHGPAPLGANAGVMIPFTVPAATAATVSGTVALTPTQLAAIVDGQAYVNFHTAAFPGGEIRGQIVAQSTAVPLTAWISGLNERPTPLTNSAAGLGLFSLDGNSLSFHITYSGLSSAATAAHIHGPAAASATGGVQIDLAPFHAGAFGTSGSFSGVVTLTPTQRTMILNGQTYFNIHTSTSPSGEARGQLATVLMSSGADGAAERTTPVISTGNALGLFALVGSQLDLNITYRTLSGSASDAHVHGPASASANAGVILPLSGFNGGAFGVSGSLTGSSTLTATTLASLIDGLTYLNFHTAANPSGEIRGQILR